jgi:hypothetical protein
VAAVRSSMWPVTSWSWYPAGLVDIDRLWWTATVECSEADLITDGQIDWRLLSVVLLAPCAALAERVEFGLVGILVTNVWVNDSMLRLAASHTRNRPLFIVVDGRLYGENSAWK